MSSKKFECAPGVEDWSYCADAQTDFNIADVNLRCMLVPNLLA